ncbi:MAG: hypothetical protein Q9M31_09075 [Mariprofundus sp.]|nr:hypothetical protein [Mariprofundus sp.]
MLKTVQLITLLLLSTFTAQSSIAEEFKGKLFFTQVNIYSLKGKVVTWVNYHIDTLIPVNTAITINKVGATGVIFTIKESGQKLKLKNKKRSSGLTGKAWVKKHFSETPIDLQLFTQSERDAIVSADIVVGMSKQAVIVSRGYPPAHKTPSLENPYWLYWQTRWHKIGVTFGGDKKVSSIKR